MSARLSWTIVAGVSVVVLGATAAVGAVAWAGYTARQNAPSEVRTVESASWSGLDRIVFRNTASGVGYGRVASVPLDDPSASRALSDLACDRVDATAEVLSCLRTVRGITPSYTATLYESDGGVRAQWPLAGIPSRTRISPDGSLVATTAFVTGHTYATVGFSTATSIHSADGTDLGDLEEWALLIDGRQSAPVDRNYWGITFADDTTFYATVGMSTAGITYLVRGDATTRTLTTLAENVECPSLSPDGTRIAFKRASSGAEPSVHWTPAVYDVATGSITPLPETGSVDDQIEWLDDGTLLYGMPRADAPGDADVWALSADGSSDPELFIEHAWSPAAVREAG